ncbi:hypothetical protein B0H19DRAFT_1241111 [Mycena capillaripes]|nr:hypothetical protein B0H19DRAFT_1241111 [Mycena capillaripes]
MTLEMCQDCINEEVTYACDSSCKIKPIVRISVKINSVMPNEERHSLDPYDALPNDDGVYLGTFGLGPTLFGMCSLVCAAPQRTISTTFLTLQAASLGCSSHIQWFLETYSKRVHQYLTVGKTISGQDKNRLESTLALDPGAWLEKVERLGPGVSFLELQICAAITQEKKHDQYAALGQQNNWPDTIDYTNVRDRILGFHGRLPRMIQNPIILKKSSVWSNFLNEINYQILKFSASSIQKMSTYGAVYTTMRLELITDERDGFNDYDKTSNLIDLNDFVLFIVTPFIAALLIADDRVFTVEEAHDVREKNSTFGDVMQPRDADRDGEIDLLHLEIIHTNPPLTPPKTEPDVKQMKTMSNPVAISVADFKEPGMKEKKPKAKPIPPSKQTVRQKTVCLRLPGSRQQLFSALHRVWGLAT